MLRHYFATTIMSCAFMACNAPVHAHATETNSASQQIPLSALFSDPDMVGVKISPDGTHISYLAPRNGAMNIWVQKIDGSDKKCVTAEQRNIDNYFWSYDNQSMFYYKDFQGNENTNLWQVNLATSETRNLTPFPESQVRLLKYSPQYPHRILVGINKDRADLHDVYLVDTQAGSVTLVEKNPGYLAGFDLDQVWYADNNLKVRLAVSFDDAGGTILHYREDQQAPWQQLLVWDVNASAASCVLGFNATNDEVYLADSSQSDKAQLVSMNLVTRERTVLAHDDEFDIISGSLSLFYDAHPAYLFNSVKQSPAAVFAARDLPRTTVLDQAIHHDMAFLQKAHRGFVYVVSTDQSFQKWIIEYVNDDQPDEYYFYDRTTQQLEHIGSNRSALMHYQCAKTEPISFTARDGRTIHGYATYPTTTDDRTNLPLVLWVHGGPWIRNSWGFDPRVQFFANRGYLCVQINYRSSSGYGADFVKAGNKESGRAMQHDLIDGAQWLIDQGIADARRIAIAGGSFGGYHALAGATFTPDFYRCAISFYGPSSLLFSVKTVPPYWIPGLIVWKHRKGNPETETEMLRAQSPLFHIDNIRIPMLIAHGAHDARVQQSASDLVVEALYKRGIPCEYLLFTTEGHGFSSAQTKYAFWGAVEKFLEQHLGESVNE
jgi:dipeptidyl aminopeptidase/acylaminoacyl peptidase